MNKQELIDYLMQYDETTLKVAIMYATYYIQDGIDITKKWETAVQQTYAMQRAENRGYAAGCKRFTTCMDCRYAKRHPGNTVFGKPLFDCKHPRYVGTEGLPAYPADFGCSDGISKEQEPHE